MHLILQAIKHISSRIQPLGMKYRSSSLKQTVRHPSLRAPTLLTHCCSASHHTTLPAAKGSCPSDETRANSVMPTDGSNKQAQ